MRICVLLTAKRSTFFHMSRNHLLNIFSSTASQKNHLSLFILLVRVGGASLRPAYCEKKHIFSPLPKKTSFLTYSLQPQVKNSSRLPFYLTCESSNHLANIVSYLQVKQSSAAPFSHHQVRLYPLYLFLTVIPTSFRVFLQSPR